LVIAGEEPGVRIPFGLTEFALGRFSDASRAMRAAASRRPVLDPDSIDLRQAYGKAGEFEAQVRALESFVGRNPFDADALFLLGFIKACTGNAVGAKAVFEKYLALPGADPAVRSFVKKVGAAA
jgi:cytochrome c-type biogenesis protein CcmH/NrfG